MVNEYLTFKQAMSYLGIKSPETLRYYITQGMPVITVGKSKKISKGAMDQFMKDHTVTTGQTSTL